MFSDAELSLIRNTFGGDGEDFLYLIRNVLLQFPLTAEEKKKLKDVMSSEVYRVVKKKILPSVDPDAPLGQLGDINQSLTSDLKVKDVEQMAPLFAAKKLEIDYLTQQFEYLMDVERDFVPKIVLDELAKIRGYGGDAVKDYIDTTARNWLLGYVDSFLIQLKTIAGQGNETDDQMKARLTRDSNK